MNFVEVIKFALKNEVDFLAREIVQRHCAKYLSLEDYKYAYEAVVAELLQ